MKNIVPHQHSIQHTDRSVMKKHKPLVIWFTGLSGSGKSTLAGALEEELYRDGIHTYLLDGDNIRTGLCKDLDFSDAGRKENIRRIGEVAQLMCEAGLVVLSAFVSPFKADRALVSSIVTSGRYMEVFVDCPLDVCEQRDVKGLYKKARSGEISHFTGIDSPFEVPDNPSFIAKTAEKELTVLVDQLFLEVMQRIR